VTRGFTRAHQQQADTGAREVLNQFQQQPNLGQFQSARELEHPKEQGLGGRWLKARRIHGHRHHPFIEAIQE
jgi:hypothetical protein